MTGFTGLFSLLLFGAFTKLFTVLTILKHGLGLVGSGMSVIVAGLAFALALLVMQPEITRAGGVAAVLRNDDLGQLEERFRPFLERHVDETLVGKFSDIGRRLEERGRPPPAAPTVAEPKGAPLAEGPGKAVHFSTLLVAFLVGELQDAFQLGVIILVPFLVIDLVIANVLLALGASRMAPEVVALPLKALLFFAVDGWRLVTEKLLQSYL